MIANHDEASFGLLRYSLGGYRPSKTARLTMSPDQMTVGLDSRLEGGVVSLAAHSIPKPDDSKPPTYAKQ